MDTLLSFLGIALPSLCTVFVAFITVRGERSKKIEELKKETERKAQEEREKKLNEKLEALSEKLDKVDERIDGLEKQVGELQKADENTLKDLRELSLQQKVNGEYIHELSKIVTVLAEGMRDQHLDGNVTKAVTAFRKFEQDTLSQLITRPVVDDD